MKATILLLFLNSIIGCSSKRTDELSGIWIITNEVDFPFDTISIESDFDTGVERTTVNTDTGVTVISHIKDSLLSKKLNTNIEVIQFHFDEETHGIFSRYTIDSQQTGTNEDPRFTAKNYTFSTLKMREKNYLILDYHFNQFGRSLDTIEYQFLSKNKLKISTDTLERIKEPL